MKLRWWGDDRFMRGATALDCIKYHMHGDHSKEARSGDIDGVMRRLATGWFGEQFNFDKSYMNLPTLEERADAFVQAAIECGMMLDESNKTIR